MNDTSRYNLYCDETCHLQYDKSDVMCVGGVVVPHDKVQEYKNIIKGIKREYGILQEIKWNTISATHIEMYEKIISFFYKSEMAFRGILIKDKRSLSTHILNRSEYNAFYFSLVEKLIKFSSGSTGFTKNDFRVFLDLKDNHGSKKLEAIDLELKQELPEDCVISHLQNIRSHESVFIQLSDIIIGAIAYKARKLDGSYAKLRLVKFIEKLTGRDLALPTETAENKFCIVTFPSDKRNG